MVHRTVHLRTVEFAAPQIALERLADGGLNLTHLLPARAAPAAVPTGPQPPSKPWTLAVDRVWLEHGALRFVDRAVQQGEPIELRLAMVEVREFVVRPGVAGQPAHLHVVLGLDQGRVRADARLDEWSPQKGNMRGVPAII